MTEHEAIAAAVLANFGDVLAAETWLDDEIFAEEPPILSTKDWMNGEDE
ncbi:MAG: hypothetical protein ACPGFA_01185 [Pikeienuella sp.]